MCGTLNTSLAVFLIIDSLFILRSRRGKGSGFEYLFEKELYYLSLLLNLLINFYIFGPDLDFIDK